ncbi:aminodeoxychorismate lyase [Halomonas sp. ML-15]|uniref:aminodeoxychorismate lyase n=1 Tax=Halomonas sp. ML-15 TaxID=2773305 RepID=UPI0017474B6E|nr:aminodeoxychorismate lyase [Halomonas sp. ML-15]MBD3897448.1 aminodeoxychorismate lyase [Halomonas sp. ML-15]
MEEMPLDDRGLAYGDGLFETVLVRDGEPLLWSEHVARLRRGAERLGFALPDEDAMGALCRQAPPGLAVLKLIVTRGSGGRGYRPPDSPTPRLRWQLASFTPQPVRWHEGVRVRHCRLRLGRQPALAGIKHLNRLENVLARGEWQDDAIAEGLLCDSHGQLVEATCMNLFWLRRGRLETPRLAHCGVAGTLREALLSELDIAEVEAGPAALLDAEAAWLGNSLQGVWPLTQLDDPQGACLRRWSLDENHRLLQDAGHRLLGYPTIR